MRLIIIMVVMMIATSADAYTYRSHCQRNGGLVYDCRICTRGHNAMTLTEYECKPKRVKKERMP